MNQVEILQQLKKDYDRGLMSALIGAGFSKNVSEKFLSWDNLLADMVRELYGSTDIKISLFPEQIKNIIEREGALKIPMRYQRKKGFREAIDAYIETHVPFVADGDEDKILLQRGDETYELKSEDFNVHRELLQCKKFVNFYTTNYDNLLEYTVQLMGSGCAVNPTPITCREELSNNIARKSIIKIHGSLRKNRTADEYGFDRDDNLCYILTEDDYKTYPQRHEAFSSFMQIAMLSGKFCLIGFSGTDPNYLSWLDWMKGVISKKNSDQQQKETQDSQETLCKVYLVSVSKDDQTDVALQMYYDNHRVAKLNLFDKSVLEEVGLPIEEDNTPKEWSCGEVLTAFFRYLHRSSEDLVVKEFTERYSSLWRSVEEKLKTGNYEAEINEIVNIKKNARFFKSFSFQKEIAQYLYNKRKDWNELEKETFLLALQDAGLTVDLLFDKIDDDIKKFHYVRVRWSEPQHCVAILAASI